MEPRPLLRRGLLPALRARTDLVVAPAAALGLPVPTDEQGARIRSLWNGLPDDTAAGLTRLADGACADQALWGADLSRLPAFADAVAERLIRLVQQGPRAALRRHLAAGVVNQGMSCR